ncbi:hypothetical protein [Maribacter halichondriae]|uniref:hypothetical protein n=1 Tax=Maribacter halichondriae TaxID=2980554 RepID=UPI0023585722|nr:hypothetical protein [Maribacter sp. Hal144]
MKKYALLFIMVMIVNSCAQQQAKEIGKEGIYSGIFSHGNFSGAISFEIVKDSTDWKVFFTSLEQNAFQIPARNVQISGDSIHFMLQSDRYTYNFKNKWTDNYAGLSGSLEVDTLLTTYSLKEKLEAKKKV